MSTFTPTIASLPAPAATPTAPEEAGHEGDSIVHIAGAKPSAAAPSVTAATTTHDPAPSSSLRPQQPPPLLDASSTVSQSHLSSSSTAPPASTSGAGSGFTSVATISSPWQYDEHQLSCTNCHSNFNALNRRHHCRLCGKIYCHSCTNQRALIPPSSIVLVPHGGKKASPVEYSNVSFTPDDDPDRMLTYLDQQNKTLLYGKGLEERFHLARQPLRVCYNCYTQLQPLQPDLIVANSNAMRYNYIDPTDVQRLWNSPLAFTLGHEIRKAAYTLNNLLPLPKRMGAILSTVTPDGSGNSYVNQQQHCKEQCSAVSPSLSNLDGVRIPARLLEQAKGVAVLTVAKGGLGIAGFEFGTGLVVARLSEGQWSAPSAIGLAGLSWGALIGAQVSDHVFLLMDDKAVELLFQQSSVTLGADVGIAVGPLGRAAEANLGAAAPNTIAPIYTYSLSKGLYAGISLDGKIVMTRNNVNENFYGRSVSGQEILQGLIPTPPAAQPLYEALTRCHVYATGSVGGVSASTQQHRLLQSSSAAQSQPPSRQLFYPGGGGAVASSWQDPVMGEYGELMSPIGEDFVSDEDGLTPLVGGGGGGHPTTTIVMPPATNDAHSYHYRDSSSTTATQPSTATTMTGPSSIPPANNARAPL